MNESNAAKNNVDEKEILELISAIAAGDFTKRLSKTKNYGQFQSIADKLNLAADSIQTQAKSQKRSELIALEDRAHLHALFTQSADPIMTLTPPTWRFTSCNPAALKLFEVPDENTFLSLGPWDLSPEMQLDGSRSSDKAKVVIMNAMNAGSHFFEWDHKTINGKVINCNVLLSRIDVAGESYLLASVRNVTEEKLRSNFLQTVLQNVPSMIFVKDFKKSLSFSLLNKAGENLLGVSSEKMIGKSDHDFFPREQAESFITKDKEVFSNKSVVKIEKEEIDTANGKRLLQTFKVPTYDANGEPHLLIGISTDITDEQNTLVALESERLKSIHTAKLASLGEMSAGVAHEINNPLAIISGSVQLLEKFKNDEQKFTAKVEAISKAAGRIQRIVKGLNKFSRSSDRAEFKNTSLAEIIKESIFIADEKLKRNRILISTEISGSLEIFCDEVEIEQVLINLINNGADAANSGSEKWVKIKAFIQGSQIILHVLDSGSGVTPEIEHKLFDPFFTTKPVGEGTGLGLSICKGILARHNATIELNRSFENTCFEIKFPFPNSVMNVA